MESSNRCALTSIRRSSTPLSDFGAEVTDQDGPRLWELGWRGHWIWDKLPQDEAFWWNPTQGESHFTYLRHAFTADAIRTPTPARVTCDSRYVLYLNGQQVGRGPVRSEPEFLGWDEYDLAPYLRPGRNVIVALCHYYGAAGPWWVPAPALGSLGRGSFCFETAASADVDIASGPHWRSVPAPWIPKSWRAIHSFPPEIIDGRLTVSGLHEASADETQWPLAVALNGGGHGTVLDRPPAAPYTTPLRRPIAHLVSTLRSPARQLDAPRIIELRMDEDPRATWHGGEGPRSQREVSVWDFGEILLGHVCLAVRAGGDAFAGSVDVVVGEELRDDGLPEIRPRSWAGRYIVGTEAEAQAAFFDPVGLRYLAVHHPPGIEVDVEVEESRYPRAPGADFACDDPVFARQWHIGARTVDMCSSDAFMDCPGREQRAWIADAYVETLVSLVTNPDTRLVRHHLELTARSRYPDGLLAGAAACDFSESGLPTPEYSLHWIRTLAAYWLYTGDEQAVQKLLPTAKQIIARHEYQRGPSGLLEEFPGWVFIDWAQVERGVVIGAHDALYGAALRAYMTLPGADDVGSLLERTREAFEQLWDPDRHAYVDALGRSGPGRRMSQQTNAAALLADIVPADRVDRLVERIIDPAVVGAGRVVVTAYPGSLDRPELIPNFQYEEPEGFDPECDLVAAQPWFCRFLHEALFQHGRRDLILASLRRWPDDCGNGTFQEFWEAPPGRTSRCHGWSASPTFDLTSYLLGVRPLTPGFGRATVDPFLGPMRQMAGRIPTPHGWLSVAIDGTDMQLEVPDGMLVSVGVQEIGPGSHSVELPPPSMSS